MTAPTIAAPRAGGSGPYGQPQYVQGRSEAGMTTVDDVVHPGATATAMVGVPREQAAAALTRAYRWLDRAVPAQPAVAILVPGLVTAVSLYTAGQYQACLVQTGVVLRAIAGLRAAQPDLPELWP